MAEPEARPLAATKEGSDSNSPAYSPTPRTFFFYYFFFVSTTFSLWPWLFIAFVLSANASKCRSYTAGEIHPSCAFNLISSFSVLCGDSHCRIHHSCMYYAFILYILLVFSLCYNWKEINIQNSSGSSSTDDVFSLSNYDKKFDFSLSVLGITQKWSNALVGVQFLPF